ncbi:MAG: hypothetical protein ACIAXF_02925 [Phycisphaerales bacterium JB063]
MKTKQPTSPRVEVEQAKAALLAPPRRQESIEHPALQLVKEHPLPAVGLAAVAGFVIVAVKPGRVLVRQTLMAGTGILLRRALAKYLRSS